MNINVGVVYVEDADHQMLNPHTKLYFRSPNFLILFYHLIYFVVHSPKLAWF